MSGAAMQGDADPTEGHCDPAFAPLRDAFRENFAAHGELGAGLAVMHRGRLVVDLWGGWCDPSQTRRWQRDTLVCMMSVAKSVTALGVHALADDGLLDLDAPIARYWPEYGCHGKAATPLRWALCHLAGVPVVEGPPRGAIYDWQAMTSALAAQVPMVAPGTEPIYHTMTQGFLLGEVLRRVTGRSPGAFLRERIAGPLGMDYAIGLTPGQAARCATMVPAAGTVLAIAQSGDPTSLLARAWAQLPAAEDFNSPAWRAAEIPSANGHGTARAIATLYGALAQGGQVEGIRVISAAALERATALQWHARSAASGLTFRAALGFFLNCPPDRPMGPNPATFGHSGAGGAQSFADPAAGIGFCYAPNRMHGGIDIGPRAQNLIEALFRCLA
jgi:CubicO group peptidase (beta-lactamase class C family)